VEQAVLLGEREGIALRAVFLSARKGKRKGFLSPIVPSPFFLVKEAFSSPRLERRSSLARPRWETAGTICVCPRDGLYVTDGRNLISRSVTHIFADASVTRYKASNFNFGSDHVVTDQAILSETIW